MPGRTSIFPWTGVGRVGRVSRLGLQAGGPLLGVAIAWEWNAETGAPFPAGTTFQRADEKWYRNGSGVWVVAGSDVPRLHNLTVGGGQQGWINEPAVTKLAIQRRDFTNAAWIKTGITAAKDATGIDGVANSCSTLTATAPNGTVFQPVTSASASHTAQFFVARKTGTGTVEITINGGSSYADITSSLTSNIDNEFKLTVTLANPSIGFRLGTSGDEIEVDCCDVEVSSVLAPEGTTPFVQDNTTSESKLKETLLTNVVSDGGFSLFADVTGPNSVGDAPVIFGNLLSGTLSLYLPSAIEVGSSIGGFNGVVVSSWLNSRLKAAMSYENPGEKIVAATGATTSVSTRVGVENQTFVLGTRTTNTQFFRGVMHNAIIYRVPQSQAAIEQLVV